MEWLQLFRLIKEVVKYLVALVAVGHLGVKLNSEEPTRPLQTDRCAVLVGCNHFHIVVKILHGIRVTHPDLRFGRHVGIQILVRGGS